MCHSGGYLSGWPPRVMQDFIMTIHKTLFVVSLLLAGAGVAVAAPLSLSLLEQRQVLASPVASPPVATTVPDEPGVVSGIPRHIAVPSLGIDVAVADGSYDARTGQWTLSEESAFYATPTAPANSASGNTFIYAHNSQKLFGKLPRIAAGASVVVTTDTGYEFTYVYQSTEAVKPTDVHALEYSGKPRLTLQTCSGLWNETRQMYYFKLTAHRKV